MSHLKIGTVNWQPQKQGTFTMSCARYIKIVLCANREWKFLLYDRYNIMVLTKVLIFLIWKWVNV